MRHECGCAATSVDVHLQIALITTGDEDRSSTACRRRPTSTARHRRAQRPRHTGGRFSAVDAQFGAPFKIGQTQSFYVTVRVDGRDEPVIPLSIVNLHTANSDVSSVAETLSKNATMLSIVGTWLPIALLIVGFVLVVSSCSGVR
ncbi:porin PorA family protein [Nocardia vinacea]|uniref:porin PorA family protein n=1 Tax=Nocardia vinacea TaxID=96468 RepID=UPI003AF35ABC